MESNFTGPKDYQKYFHGRDYLQTYFDFDQCDIQGPSWLLFILKQLHQTFSSGDVRGDTLIDIGTGPSIYHLLSACECFREIIATDYLDRNLQELERWLKMEPGAFDWSPVVKYVCELEGDSEQWAKKEEKLRKTVKQFLKCDITKKNPLEPLALPQADCLLTCLCLEAACKDLDVYGKAMKNITTLLKPGGHFLLFLVLQETYYTVGQHRFSCLYLEKEQVEQIVQETGYCVEHLEVAPSLEKDVSTLADYDAMMFLIARKMKGV
ncbi:indolethylamine N-methyltransferase-like [Rhinatrema bivittatum]|uniref:indolethylamine N-methyltransferase-like n=1 Tax=Rhinatrema bivittatum TaxID=194408 RepID=UPI00112AC27E|nr:indolethylamine N-methyltransferase-like [Rhinatrema bivittatum]XP_029428897.1 indolethylamine N-methyltransferase-like [Rhinatrema bivittatum]XP_029428898.1 indolethylamine N-methyltransferase-like [Rhinatrema bivittatum]